jgi:hypothetical protein
MILAKRCESLATRVDSHILATLPLTCQQDFNALPRTA